LGLKSAFGEIPIEKINLEGGSLALGHPFGATGGRLLITAARQLTESDGEYALISACAAGGQGSSILLRKIKKTAKKVNKKAIKKVAKKVVKKVAKKTTKKMTKKVTKKTSKKVSSKGEK
jgi:hypothetical protein